MESEENDAAGCNNAARTAARRSRESTKWPSAFPPLIILEDRLDIFCLFLLELGGCDVCPSSGSLWRENLTPTVPARACLGEPKKVAFSPDAPFTESLLDIVSRSVRFVGLCGPTGPSSWRLDRPQRVASFSVDKSLLGQTLPDRVSREERQRRAAKLKKHRHLRPWPNASKVRRKAYPSRQS